MRALPILFALLLAVAHAQSQVRIYQPPSHYFFHGCYNETTALGEGNANSRALEGGTNEVLPGDMTVQKCLDFCRTGTTYKYAGLQFARECWCGNRLSTLSAKFSDTECNLPCDGDTSIACGGTMKLSVYISAARSTTAAASGLVMALAAVVSVVSIMS